MARKKALSRDDILGTSRTERYDSDVLGGTVYLQPLPFAVAKRLMAERFSTNGEVSEDEVQELEIDPMEMLDECLVYGIVDEDGERIFGPEDAEELADKVPFGVAMEIVGGVMRLTGWSTDVGEDEDEEDEAGN